MLAGMLLVANTVSVTMWPKGRNVAIDSNDWPVFTNDWVTVVREIFCEDKVENIGASLIKEVCEKTNKQAGDGTTTTAILTYAIAQEWLKYVREGMNPFALSKWLQEVGQEVVEIIRSQGKQLETKDEIQQVAAISAQDEDIGTLIADIMDEVGNDWTITVEEWPTIGVTHLIKKWLQFDSGYISPYMANKPDNTYKETNIAILVTDISIEKFKQITPIIKKLIEQKIHKLVIICPEMEWDALIGVVRNKVDGNFDCVAIHTPYSPVRNQLLQDIAIVAGANFITQEMWQKLEWVEIKDLGTIASIESTQTETIMIQSDQHNWAIEDRIARIRIDITSADSDYLKTKHQERLNKLAGGIGIIYVGAPTKMEMRQRKFKIEDALNATKSALAEWIVDGWGTALASIHIMSSKDNEYPHEYVDTARKILTEAIKYPYQTIIRNAWYDPEQITKDQPLGMWFDSNAWIYKNMMEAGIIDPIKVIRVALENAISAATMLLTTEATITDEKTTNI